MSNQPMQIVPATPALVAAFFGKPSPWTFRGHAALIGDKVVGLGGVSIVDGLPIAFTDMTDELRARIKDRARCFRFLEREFQRHAGRLFALCSEDEPTAPRILARLGFKPVGGQLMVREASNV